MKTFLLIASMVALAVAGPTRTPVYLDGAGPSPMITETVVSPGGAGPASIDEILPAIVEPAATGRCQSIVGPAVVSNIVINIYDDGRALNAISEAEPVQVVDVAPEPVELPQPVLPEVVIPEPVVVGTPIIPAPAVNAPEILN